MPYIRKGIRVVVDDTRNPDNSGELNYLITKLVDQYLVEHGFCYASINDVVGALECAKLELYRRLAAPYEDTKIIENGDVYESAP